MVDLNTLVPSGSALHLTIPITINDRGEIAGLGVLSNGDEHAFLLIPCGEGDEGCGDSAAFATPGGAVERPKVNLPENVHKLLRQRMGQRYRIPGISELAINGNCEGSINGTLTGYCVGHRPPYNICDIQPSTSCPKGAREIKPGFTSCGLASDRIDLARSCSL